MEIVNNRMYIYGVSMLFDRFFTAACGKLTDYAKNCKIYATIKYGADDSVI